MKISQCEKVDAIDSSLSNRRKICQWSWFLEEKCSVKKNVSLRHDFGSLLIQWYNYYAGKCDRIHQIVSFDQSTDNLPDSGCD